MTTKWMGARRSISVPSPRVITLPRRAIADRLKVRTGEACEQIYSWTRTNKYSWALGVVVAGFSVHFFYVQEMLAALVLFSLTFFSLSLVALSVFFVYYAGNRAAIGAGPTSLEVVARFQRQTRRQRVFWGLSCRRLMVSLRSPGATVKQNISREETMNWDRVEGDAQAERTRMAGGAR